MSKFNDLSEDRQLEIVHTYMPDDWHDFIIEEIQEELSQAGFCDPKISYSGWYSQGDGASFTCENIDVFKFYKHAFTENWDFQFRFDAWDISESENSLYDNLGIVTINPMETLMENNFWVGSIRRNNNRYVHENSTEVIINTEDPFFTDSDPDYSNFEITGEDEIEIDSLTQYLDTYISRWVRDKCKEIYNRLYKEHESYIESELESLRESNDDWD